MKSEKDPAIQADITTLTTKIKKMSAVIVGNEKRYRKDQQQMRILKRQVAQLERLVQSLISSS